MVQMSGQPVLILPEGTQRVVGKDAQRINILVAKAVASAIKSTLGPKGMDKMLVDDLGDIVITNDGATILDEMNVEHPAAKMMVEIAKTQDKEVGDGTTTAVVIAGELLTKAEELLDKKIHPTIVIKGYRIAADKAIKELDSIAMEVKPEDEKTLKKLAITSMTGKGVEEARDTLASIVVSAVKQVAEKDNGKVVIDTDYIKIEKKQGGDLEDTELINGVIIDKERVHPGMPRVVKDAKIALINAPIEVKETETDAEIRITSPDQLQAFLDQEEKMLREMVDKIKASGANVVFCQKGIDDLAQHFLAKEGILAVRRVKKSDMEKLAKATGATIITSIKDLSEKDLGYAGKVEERKISGENMIFVENCKDPKAVTILVRGGTEHVVDEAERALNDAIGVVSSAMEDGKVVTGGGSTEVALAMRLREYAKTVGGREQLAIEAFANALEIIPTTLAESAGMDPIDTLVELRAKQEKEKNPHLGIDVFKGKIVDMEKDNVLEPMRVKKQAIASASEAAEMILRIDDIIAATSKKSSGGGNEMGGMGGMGGGFE
uniref:Archaeal thermosome n=1 Tax=uncultured euryarchaeote Alv-FOS5 TaxID=337891 RepID=Q3SBB1_9EURY|nr:archaeal thermosome [uncultured euryarchaeote Alv-FOS5]